MTQFDRPYYPDPGRERGPRGRDRRFGRRDERDPSDFDRGRYFGREGFESETYGYGPDELEERRRFDPFGGEWERFPGDYSGERRPSGGIYSGTPSGQRGYEQQRGYDQRGSGYPRQGRFSGQGPKGYQRSDDRLKDEVCDRLTADPDIDASELTVNVKEGEVTLEGRISDRQMKRSAEDCVESVSGVRQVHNRLRVEPGEGSEYDRGMGRQGGGSAADGSEAQRSGAGRKTSH